VGVRWGEALNCVWAVENEGCGTNEACHTCGAFLAISEALEGMYGVRECRFTQTMSGKTEWLDLSISVSPAIVGEERFLVCTVRDISSEKRKAVLERIFFHDLLNNLTGVELLAHMLKSMVAGDASIFAQQISACASQLVEEIHSQQLLVAAEKEELAVKPVALSTGIYTDDSILRRVLENMVKNALEASKTGETVRVGCRDAGNEVEFWTHNPGVIPDTIQLQIFQRSFSTKGTGRGLGTYSMKLLSERYLKGAVSFLSSAGEGTAFIARYPKMLTREGLVQLEPKSNAADPAAR
jgi:K+-sensing histidine kinase KdpD